MVRHPDLRKNLLSADFAIFNELVSQIPFSILYVAFHLFHMHPRNFRDLAV